MSAEQMAREPRALSMGRSLARGDLNAIDVATIALDSARASESVFTTLTDDRARLEAQAASARLQAGYARGPLDGVPIAWKDLVDVCGTPTSAGSQALLEHRGNAQHDAPMVRHASGAGLVTIGKTNLSELAYSALGLNPHFGTPRNPADKQIARVPGGSSAGSAVAVAAGIVPLALGTDTGGSLRVPAAFNGLVSYRPSRAGYTMTGVTPLARSLDIAGPMATSVADCLAFDACLRGDEHTSRPSLRPDSIRLVVDTAILKDNQVETSVADNLRTALDTLARAGAQIVWREISTVHEVLNLIASTGWLGAPEAYAEYRWLLESRSAEAMDPRVRDRLALAADMSPDRVVHLYRERERLIAACRNELEGALLVLPTVAHVAPPLEPLERDAELFKRVNLATLRLTMIGSFLDMPTIALPTGVDGARQHTSLQISASQGEDDTLKFAALTVSRLLDIEH